MNVRSTILAPMRDIQVGRRIRMRQLSLGSKVGRSWGAWSWTFCDGSTWANIGFSDTAQEDMIGWASVTFETDLLPVVACYVRSDCRGHGIACGLVTNLLYFLISEGVLYPGAALFASTQRWPRWTEVVESCGLRCLTWQ